MLTVLATTLLVTVACATAFYRHVKCLISGADAPLMVGHWCKRCGTLCSERIHLNRLGSVCKACFVVLPGACAEFAAANRSDAWHRLVRRHPTTPTDDHVVRTS